MALGTKASIITSLIFWSAALYAQTKENLETLEELANHPEAFEDKPRTLTQIRYSIKRREINYLLKNPALSRHFGMDHMLNIDVWYSEANLAAIGIGTITTSYSLKNNPFKKALKYGLLNALATKIVTKIAQKIAINLYLLDNRYKTRFVSRIS